MRHIIIVKILKSTLKILMNVGKKYINNLIYPSKRHMFAEII
jgi:hypothetical protein